MTQKTRIALNVAATYGRSLYSLALGLFSARWALEALGHDDFGLYGVVGGLVTIVTILNTQMASAIGRFFAISVGEMRANPVLGLNKCQMWFTTAVLVHTILPTILVAVGYPLGIWIIENSLKIPLERLNACIWVWRFSCLSAFVGMVNVPFQAMYTAKQEIAEMTLYSLISTTFTFGLLFYMVTHPGIWLVKYAMGMCLIGVLPRAFICARGIMCFPECRFRLQYVHCWKNVVELVSYAGWQTLGGLGWLLREQGIAIVINRSFGAAANAAATIGTCVSGHCNTLASSLVGAFSPAIMNAYGAGELTAVRDMAYRTCRIGTLMVLMFSIPLALEVDEVLLLWLKTPPRYAAGLCLCVLAMNVLDKTAEGCMIAINADGRISKCLMAFGATLFFTAPLAWFFVHLGWGIYSVGYAAVTMMFVGVLVRIWFAQRLIGISMSVWMKRILLPLMGVSLASFIVGMVPRELLSPSLGRVCVTSLVAEAMFLILSWTLVLESTERVAVLALRQRMCEKIFGRRCGK